MKANKMALRIPPVISLAKSLFFAVVRALKQVAYCGVLYCVGHGVDRSHTFCDSLQFLLKMFPLT